MASPAQAVTLTNSGNAALTLTSIAVTGDFAQTNNCGSTVTAGASCTINVTFTPTAGGARSGAVTITDNASGSPQTVALTGTGKDFTVTTSFASAMVATGQTASYTLSLTPVGGFSQAVALACTGAPSLAVCSVSGSPTKLNGATASTATVTVTTTARTVLTPRGRRFLPPGIDWRYVLLLSLLLLVVGPGLALARPGRGPALHGSRWTQAALAGMSLVVMLALGLAACGGGGGYGGGGGGGNPGTPAGTYTLTVTATFTSGSTTLTHSLPLTLTVN